MVNHKCPALFLLTLQSQQLPAHSAELCPDPLLSPCCDPQGMGKWAEEEEMPETASAATSTAVSMSGSSRPEKREVGVPAHSSVWLMLSVLPHAASALFPCVCVCAVLPLAPGMVFTLCIQNNTT